MTTKWNPAPKPTKKSRVNEKAQKHTELVDYRRVQSARAIERDNSQCIFCWFLEGKVTPRDEIHHVYSRGKEAGDWREHYRSLACTCKRHHPLPIQTPGANLKLAYVEAVLKMANDTPINTGFKHVGS